MQSTACGEWTVVGLERAFRERDLPLCRTQLERQCATAVHGVEVRRTADRLAGLRKLTPGEVAIANGYGWNPRRFGR